MLVFFIFLVSVSVLADVGVGVRKCFFDNGSLRCRGCNEDH